MLLLGHWRVVAYAARPAGGEEEGEEGEGGWSRRKRTGREGGGGWEEDEGRERRRNELHVPNPNQEGSGLGMSVGRREAVNRDDHDIEWGNTSPHSQATCLEMRSGNEARIHT